MKIGGSNGRIFFDSRLADTSLLIVPFMYSNTPKTCTKSAHISEPSSTHSGTKVFLVRNFHVLSTDTTNLHMVLILVGSSELVARV